MTLAELLEIFTAAFFAFIAIILLLKEEETRRLLVKKDVKQKQRIYEISVLREIQDRIGYELDIEKVADVITGSLRNLFTYSTASSLLFKNGKLLFKIYAEEGVSHAFTQQVKRSIFASFETITGKTLPPQIDEVISGEVLQDDNTDTLNSFFNIPLIINNEILGIINIASTKPDLYKEEEMTILYQITNLASTALTRLHQVLNTEKGKLMAMIASLSDGVFMTDVDSRLLVINQAARSMLGIPKENPTTIDIINIIQKQYDIGPKLEEAISNRRIIQEKEIQLGDRTIQVFINPVSDAQSQKVIGASVLLHDITLEKNLAQMKDDFTNMIIHELRAPLTAIKGASQLMTTSPESLDKSEQAKLMGIIHEQSSKLLELVATLLDAAKLESGRFNIKKEPHDLRKVIEQSIAVFLPEAESKHIDIVFQAEEDLPPVAFDSIQLGQVMNNLLSNSIKFTPGMGKIIVSIKNQENFVLVSVKDNGVGIPKEKQEKLFSKFYQAQHAKMDLKYITAGTGLGLYIVKGIVEAHGGNVYLESEVGKGTTISFTIPVAEKKQAAIPTSTIIEKANQPLPPPPPPSRLPN